MVWEEIKRIFAGADDEGRGPREQAPRPGDMDHEISGELGYGVEAGAHVLSEGVVVDPLPVRQGEAFTVEYDGLLARQGAAGIVLHAGYGRETWSHVQDIPMQPMGHQRWQATVFSDRSGPFSFCFRDTAGHWDNNAGRNWSIHIQPPG